MPLFRTALHGAGSLLLGFAVAAGGFGLAAPRAEAQGLFGNWDSPPPRQRKKVKRPRRDADESSKASRKQSVAERDIKGPLVVNVSLSRQRLTVYDAEGPIAEAPISSGRVGYATPTGVFTVIQKRRMHYSNLYAGAPMPNMQRITWSGVALHAGALPGYPASHGCIRLPHGFSKKLFGMTKMGTRVIVSREPVKPVPFAHDRLFAAYPPDGSTAAEGSSEAHTQVADASGMTGSASVSAVLGVSVAAAAIAEHSTDVSPRQSFRERRRLEAERLNAEIRTAGYEKATKASILARAAKESEAARAPLIAARAEADRTAEALAKLEKAKARGERELADLEQSTVETPGKTLKAKKADRKKARKSKLSAKKRAARIAELKEELAELPAELETTRAAWEAADRAFKAAAEVAKSAESKRRAAAKDLMQVNAVLAQALAKERAAKKLEEKRHLPVSIFISRAKQRLYIRQGWEDILDVPVTFENPDDPVGTHVFTALDYAEGKTAMTWSAVSVPYDPTRASKKKKSKKKSKAKPEAEVARVDLESQTPAAALDRITMPEDVREQIADVMKPGSSLIISDLGLSNETGEYTDFIASIR